MARSQLSIMDIPHIVDSIFDLLPFADLYRCVFVSHAWHNALIARLWQDVVTFRPVPDPTFKVKATLEYCFQTPDSRAALSKHAHHVRALTCRGDAILSVLIEAGVIALSNLTA